ncbi:MAG: hypothetical protein JHC33_14095 [Ignisphaera sp.]|nr:hypothetical protein [Ignisphaera sp.]
MKLNVEAGKVLRVLGPVRISVEKGRIRILGIDIESGKDVWISRYRSYAVKVLEPSTIGVVLGIGGSIENAQPDEEPIDVWENTANEITNRGGKVLILGFIESGKTTFATLLSNIAIEKGLDVALIDADIGQCDLAPPGFIALKFMDRKVLWLREVAGDIIRFIGYLSPSQGTALSRLLSSVVELVNIAESKGAELIIVNTDGWFGDFEAIQYKLQLIKALKPENVVIMGEDACRYIEPALSKFSLMKLFCLPIPKVVRKRDREDRRQLRKVNYSNYFQKARRRCFKFEDISILNSCLLNGVKDAEIHSKLQQELNVPIYMASRYDDTIVVAVPDDAYIDKRDLYIIKPAQAKGLLVALLNSSLEDVGVGIIDSIDFEKREICILTEYEGEVRGIDIGRIIIGKDWMDKGIAFKCVI